VTAFSTAACDTVPNQRGAERLSRPARSALLRGPNVLSAVAFWEVSLKSAKKKLDVGDPRVWWETALIELAATSLPLRAEHIAELQDVPALHSDPFDRVLIAQAAAESLAFVTTDGKSAATLRLACV